MGSLSPDTPPHFNVLEQDPKFATRFSVSITMGLKKTNYIPGVFYYFFAHRPIDGYRRDQEEWEKMPLDQRKSLINKFSKLKQQIAVILHHTKGPWPGYPPLDHKKNAAYFSVISKMGAETASCIRTLLKEDKDVAVSKLNSKTVLEALNFDIGRMNFPDGTPQDVIDFIVASDMATRKKPKIVTP